MKTSIRPYTVYNLQTSYDSQFAEKGDTITFPITIEEGTVAFLYDIEIYTTDHSGKEKSLTYGTDE